MGRIISTNDWIDRVVKIHNNEYKYDDTVYVNTRTKVTVTCKIHGNFDQWPVDHVRGAGCPSCARQYKPTTSEWVASVSVVHSNFYTYNNTKYLGANKRLTITCPVHGDFEQIAKKHKAGLGCSKCSGRYVYGNEEWVLRATAKHRGMYSYENTKYIGSAHPVNVTCSKHGEFKQSAASHLQGVGCPRCAGLGASTEEWILDAQQKHGNFYDYSNTIFTKQHDHVSIGCPIHGDFQQVAYTHIQGAGCPLCGVDNKSEDACFPYIQRLFPNDEIIQSARLPWLDRQHLDFYIHDQRIAIEYNGKQHYQPIEHWGGQNAFKAQQKRDKRKRRLCVENNINLIEIPHYEFNCCTPHDQAVEYFQQLTTVLV